MKKMMRYFLFGSVMLSFLFFITACGKKADSGEQAIEEMLSALEEITSVRMSLAVDWDQAGEAAVALRTDIEQMSDPTDYHIVLKATQGTGSTSQEIYTINQQDNLTCSYIKEKNKWTVYEHEPLEEDVARKVLLTAGSGWAIGEEEEINGILCTVLNGEVPANNMAGVFKASGLGITAIQTGAKGIVTLYQDKETKLPVLVTVDCGTIGDMESILIQCMYQGFNDLDAIIVPEEVVEAAVR